MARDGQEEVPLAAVAAGVVEVAAAAALAGAVATAAVTLWAVAGFSLLAAAAAGNDGGAGEPAAAGPPKSSAWPVRLSPAPRAVVVAAALAAGWRWSRLQQQHWHVVESSPTRLAKASSSWQFVLLPLLALEW